MVAQQTIISLLVARPAPSAPCVPWAIVMTAGRSPAGDAAGAPGTVNPLVHCRTSQLALFHDRNRRVAAVTAERVLSQEEIAAPRQRSLCHASGLA